ncbi:MAG: hypothetical protein NTV34_11840 [Proteobacteria bacterium]|nr:hypothetical protein [Pseudomonadota bacterium]
MADVVNVSRNVLLAVACVGLISASCGVLNKKSSEDSASPAPGPAPTSGPSPTPGSGDQNQGSAPAKTAEAGTIEAVAGKWATE